MEESILRFNEQLKYEPELINADKLKTCIYKSYILCGMGGSHLAADFLRDITNINIMVHSDYDLPKHYDKRSLFIISSFSGNTEEAISSYYCAKANRLNIIVVSCDSENSKLLNLAKSDDTPYIVLPSFLGIQPRLCLYESSNWALGLYLKALSYVCISKVYNELKELNLDPKSLQGTAQYIVKSISNKIPIIYTSNHSKSIGYNWKIKLNETAKIPAFCNVLPELNHNEMVGYDVFSNNEGRIDKYIFIFLYDFIDPRITKRMNILSKQLKDLGYLVIDWDVGKTIHQKLETILIADWVSYYIAINNGADPEQVKMIEEFKAKLNG